MQFQQFKISADFFTGTVRLSYKRLSIGSDAHVESLAPNRRIAVIVKLSAGTDFETHPTGR